MNYKSTSTPKASKAKFGKSPSRFFLNATLQGNSTLSVTRQLNSTIFAPGGSNAGSLALKLVEAECDFASNQYLQSLMKKLILVNNTTTMKIKCNDQLLMQQIISAESTSEENALKQKIAIAEAKIRLDAELELINITYQNYMDMATVPLAHEMNNCLDIINYEENKLHLKNIESFNEPDVYKKFETLIGHCKNSVAKYLSIVEVVDVVHNLANDLIKNSTLSDKTIDKVITSEVMKEDVTFSMLEKTDILLRTCANIKI